MFRNQKMSVNFDPISLLQPALLKAIFNVDPDEVRSLIFKKEDVNTQVITIGRS